MKNKDILKRLASSFEASVIEKLEATMDEIGELTPVWHDEFECFYVEHKSIPEGGGGETPDEALLHFWGAVGNLLEGLELGDLSPVVEKQIKSPAMRGGKREGAGRPKKEPRTRVMIPNDLVFWLKSEDNLQTLRQFIQGKRPNSFQ